MAMKERLDCLVNQANELKREMHKELIEFVQSHGGFIRTDDEDKFSMRAICIDEFTDDAVDKRILAVAVFGTYNPSLCVLVGADYDYNDGELTSEDMLEDSHWLDVYGDGIFSIPTIIALCNGIMNFIE